MQKGDPERAFEDLADDLQPLGLEFFAQYPHVIAQEGDVMKTAPFCLEKTPGRAVRARGLHQFEAVVSDPDNRGNLLQAVFQPGEQGGRVTLWFSLVPIGRAASGQNVEPGRSPARD